MKTLLATSQWLVTALVLISSGSADANPANRNGLDQVLAQGLEKMAKVESEFENMQVQMRPNIMGGKKTRLIIKDEEAEAIFVSWEENQVRQQVEEAVDITAPQEGQTRVGAGTAQD